MPSPDSDAFFNSELTTNNAAPRQRRAPPPPPPRAQTTAASAASGSSIAATGAMPRPGASASSSTTRARPVYKSNRAVSSAASSSSTPTIGATTSRPPAAAAAAAAAVATTTIATEPPPRAKTTSSARPAPSAGTTRKAPVMRRPVGTYYASTTDSSAAPPATSDSTNTWDWSTPTPTSSFAPVMDDPNSTSDWANPAAAASSAAPAFTSSSSSSDWYSAPSASTGTAPGPAPAASSSPYTSTGFSSLGGRSGGAATSNGAGSGVASNTPIPSFAQPMQQQQPGTGFYQSTPQSMQTQGQHQPFLTGAMDASAPSMMSAASNNVTTAAPAPLAGFSMFMPAARESFTQLPGQPLSQDPSMMYPPIDEPPLLEELGINLEHILLKTKTVVLPFSRFGGDKLDPVVICQDADLAGPVAFALILGGEMVLTGKLQFGYIYGFGLFGCVSMTFVVNLMSPADAISFWTVTSILGYSLLPVNILALVKIFVINLINLQTLGRVLGVVAVAWSTTASTRLLEVGCGLRSQRYLIAYPIALLYSAFVLMTIF